MSEDVKHDETEVTTEETTQEVADNESDGEQETDNPDYKAELERLRELDRKKSGALKEERERRKKAEEVAKERPELDEDAVSKIVKRALEEDRKARTVDYYEDTLDKECPDKDFRDLVKYHYENTIRTTGESRKAIERDIARAKLLANEAKYMSEAQKKAKREVAERQAYMKDGKDVRSEREDTRKRGAYLTHDGEEIKPQNAAERKLLDSFGLKKI